MGEYADIKRNRILRLLKWLANKNKDIAVIKGGNHVYMIKYSFWERPFPIPFKHSVVNKHIVKKLMKKLTEEEICTKEEFDKKLGK